MGVLQLSSSDITSTPWNYDQRLEHDRIENASKDKIETWAGAVTGSFVTTFFVSGAISDRVGQCIGREVVMAPRTLVRIYSTCENSGSGDVTSIDIRAGGVTSDKSIFVNNAAARVNISSSTGDNPFVQSGTFATNSASLGALTVLTAYVLSAAGAAGVSAMTNVAVHLVWKPSGSYGV